MPCNSMPCTSKSCRYGSTSAKGRGFTLIELVVGMLVIGIALVMMSTILFPQADRAAVNLYRVRSAELAHSILNEIWGKRFDEASAIDGTPACGSPSGAPCSLSLGPDGGEERNDFDDVDDFNGLNETATLLGSSDTYADRYPRFKLLVTVSNQQAGHEKLIQVDVTTPAGEVITYHALRSNY
ncbi:type II secretion system protein [Shewanella cyperi]|uniref:Type II secretion system protein n=2 Tax=Shewanella cyperi TaxID=2814292 RepID=A0A974XSI8_9GAMM|nr:type II secretion system protein [Shewanella cyperi]